MFKVDAMKTGFTKLVKKGIEEQAKAQKRKMKFFSKGQRILQPAHTMESTKTYCKDM
jgi:predicted transcriptional regulator